MKRSVFGCSIAVFVFLFIAMSSGCLGEAADEPALPEEQDKDIGDESGIVKSAPGMLVEAPEGILVKETKILGDRIIVVLENTASEKVFLSKIGIDVLYDVDRTGVEYFEKQMDSYLEPGQNTPITIKVRTLSDWQDSEISKIVVSP